MGFRVYIGFKGLGFVNVPLDSRVERSMGKLLYLLSKGASKNPRRQPLNPYLEDGALYPYTMNPYMVYEPETLLGPISSLR